MTVAKEAGDWEKLSKKEALTNERDLDKLQKSLGGIQDLNGVPDQWTVKTKDRSLSAQWEHTILVTRTGVEVLTWSDGTPKAPACVGQLHYRPNPVAA